MQATERHKRWITLRFFAARARGKAAGALRRLGNRLFEGRKVVPPDAAQAGEELVLCPVEHRLQPGLRPFPL